jgi:hypothetical protein
LEHHPKDRLASMTLDNRFIADALARDMIY